MHQEFELVSARYIFRLEDMTSFEQKIWKDHLKNEGFEITDPHEFFEPFQGEFAQHYNSDVGTQELRIQIWKWNDLELYDMNYWPGDNESGVIAIDGEVAINNSDRNLDYFGDSKLFDSRLEFFETIRNHLDGDYEPEDEQIEEQYDLFINSDAGKRSKKIQEDAWNEYRFKIDKIRDENNFLENKYLHEFKFIKRVPEVEVGAFRILSYNIDEVISIADEIGYKSSKNIFDKFDEQATFTYILWIPKNIILVTVRENYNDNTYILNNKGKIEKHVFKEHYYLADDLDLNVPLYKELSTRIHSYLLVLLSPTSY